MSMTTTTQRRRPQSNANESEALVGRRIVVVERGSTVSSYDPNRESCRDIDTGGSEEEEEEDYNSDDFFLQPFDEMDSIDSISTVEDLLEDEDLIYDAMHADEMLLEDDDTATKSVKDRKQLDLERYMAQREMTPFQERVNAWTVVPNPFFCLYFILAGHWISTDHEYSARDLKNFDTSACLHSTWFPHFTGMPPPTVVAVFLGIALHAPFSFLYHYKYAHSLPAGIARTNHWSRRMDQSFIHVCSAFMSYATTASWDFCLANVIFNADCIYRQFKKKVRPRRNQIRLFISIVAYTLPLLRRGEWVLFSKCWLVLLLSGYFFITYPVGGWSHAFFHIAIAFLPPLLMEVASTTLASQREYVEIAAQCAAVATTTSARSS